MTSQASKQPYTPWSRPANDDDMKLVQRTIYSITSELQDYRRHWIYVELLVEAFDEMHESSEAHRGDKNEMRASVLIASYNKMKSLHDGLKGVSG